MEHGHGALGEFILLKLDQIVGIVGEMDDETANAALDVDGSNSPYQVLEHCLGMS
ncbi:hypothetical protein [Ornithinimicrobium panacihumi]|uniref:hypothetical protein n=1 Tax=Ornithinimicrobium panacihumi TaxID=2008449 RepID=UPI003F8BD051